MGTGYFKFKQFEVWHDRCGLKVGTDGVLIGSWTLPALSKPCLRVLDVGTGSGLIALMMAQRFGDATVTAVDIDPSAVSQARDNAASSRFSSRIEVVQDDFMKFSSRKEEACYDLIVSNPPFHVEDTACPDSRKNTAKHSASLPFRQLVEGSARLLSADGTLSVILPYSVANDFVGLAAVCGLYLVRRCDVRGSERKPFKRSMLSFCRHIGDTERTELTLRDSDNRYTDAYSALTDGFYL